MRILIDTHVFLWYVSADRKLPAGYRAAIQDPTNDAFLSTASIWEAVIKHQLGKLPLPGPAAEYLVRQRLAHFVDTLMINEETIVALSGLPPHHRDPFDRLIVAHAIQHGLTIATVDPAFAAYSVGILPTT
jgi:PIN domain nuclease of toxin-antitoxin system